MRLVGQVYVTVRNQVVTRDPSVWEKLKRGLGAKVDLQTEEVRNELEATAVVDGVRRALGKLGVTNALSLVVDDTVVFQDTDSKPDDLPDLVLALSEHASLFGRGFRELRFAAEHEEAGLHLIIETRARTHHHRDEPAAVVSVGGRVRALEPNSGESAEAYRARVEPLLADRALFETARHAFESFVARVEAALRAALPEATVAQKRAEARLVKAADRAPAAPEKAPQSPMHPAYDPFLVYHPSPMSTMLDAMMFASFMHMMMPPHISVVNPAGASLGSMPEVQAHPELASDNAHGAGADHGADQGADDLSSGGDGDGGFGDAEAGGWDGGFDSGGSDSGGFDGGSFDGGGFD
jgi:hypothetical protein